MVHHEPKPPKYVNWFPKKHLTRKDWYHNDTLSGTNSQFFKRAARRLFRRTRGLYQYMAYKRVTGGYRYDINDFK